MLPCVLLTGLCNKTVSSRGRLRAERFPLPLQVCQPSGLSPSICSPHTPLLPLEAQRSGGDKRDVRIWMEPGKTLTALIWMAYLVLSELRVMHILKNLA